MADERTRTRKELKQLFTGLKNKPITDELMSIAIDSLWRDKINQRTGGFFHAGSFDSVISFDAGTGIFSIKPFDPLVADYIPRFLFHSWSSEAVLHRNFYNNEIEIPNEEGLYCIYFDSAYPGRDQVLTIAKNPTAQELRNLHFSKVVISFIYWDQENQSVIYFGDDRHGSEWNPQIRWYLNQSFGARRETGLQITDFVVNGDGSNNNHAQFLISEGTIIHDDFQLKIPASELTIPILYFSTDNHPRFKTNAGYSVYKEGNRICYNANQNSIAEVENGNFVIYHYFATNETGYDSRKIISVMGTSQYTSIQAAYSGNRTELSDIQKYIPMQGLCYIESAIFQTSNDYTNTIKSRIVGFISSLWPDTNEYFTEMLLGDIDGVNTIFTTSKPYSSGNITVLLNGLKEYHFSEINETTIEFITAPKSIGFTDIIESIYKIK